MRHRFHKDGQWVGLISRGSAVAAVVSTAGLLQSLPSAYGQVVWDGGGNGTSMSGGLNWVGDAVPTSGQDAVIDNSNVTVPSTIEIGDSLFGENYGTLTIDTGNTNLNIKALLTSSGFTSSTLFLDGNFTGTSDLIKIGSSVTSATITISDGAAPPTSTGQAIIELADDGKINVINSGATLTIRSLIQGSGFIFEKTGSGTLNLGGNGVAGNSNTFGGSGKVLKISGGTLGVAVDGSMGNASNTVQLSSGAKIKAIVNASGPFGSQVISGFTTTRALALTSGGGTIDDSGSTIVWAGQITGTGGLTKTGAGTLTLSGSSIHTYTGATNINQGTLSLSGYTSGTSPSQTFVAGGRALSTDFNVTNGGTLLLDSSDKTINVGGFPPSGTTVNNRNDDRIGGTYDGVSSFVTGGKAVNLSWGNFTVTGSSFGAIQEFFGSLNFQAGPNTVTLAPHGTTSGVGFPPVTTFTPTVALYLTADSISRSSLSTVLINGDNLGSGTANPDPGITLFTVPTMTGGAGASGTVTMSILPYAVGNSSPRTSPSNYGLMSYQVDFNGTNFTSLGLRNLRSNEYDTLTGASGSSNHNVRVTGAETIAGGGQTVNGLVVAGGSIADSGSNDTLTVTTGAILGTNNGGSSTPGSIDAATLAFGGSEAIISTYGSNLTISSKITGSGLTIIKNGPTNSLSQGVLFLSNSTSDYTGQTLIYGGAIEVTADGALGTTAGNTVVYSSSALIFNGVNYTTAEPVTVNGTGFGTFSIFGSTQYAAIHDVTADSTFSGPVTLGSNSSIAANGGLTLTLNGGIGEANSGLLLIIGTSNNGSGTVVLGGASTYTGGTRLDVGTLAIGHNSAIGSGNLIFNGGGISASGGPRSISNPVVFGDNGGSAGFTGSEDLTFTGTFNAGNFAHTLNVTNLGDTTIAGTVSGASTSGLIKNGDGLLRITASNAGYAGSITISAGELSLEAANAAGTGTVKITGGVLSLAANNAIGGSSLRVIGGVIRAVGAPRSSSASIVFGESLQAGTGYLPGIMIVAASEDLTLTGAVDLGYAIQNVINPPTVDPRRITVADSGTTLTLSGTITSQTDNVNMNPNHFAAKAIVKNGEGKLVLSGQSTFGYYNAPTPTPTSDVSSFKLEEGTLGLGTSSTLIPNPDAPQFFVIGTSPVGVNDVSVAPGVAFEAVGATRTLHNRVKFYPGNTEVTFNAGNDLVFSGGFESTGDMQLNVYNTTDFANIQRGTVRVNSGANDMIKTGPGTAIFSAYPLNLGGSIVYLSNLDVKDVYVLDGNLQFRGSFSRSNNAPGTIYLGDTGGSNSVSLLQLTGPTNLFNTVITVSAIDVRSGNSGIATIGGTYTSGASFFIRPVVLNKDVNLTAAGGGTVYFAQPLANPGDAPSVISGPGAVNKVGDGTVGLYAQNTYQGGTNILGGTLVVGGANLFPPGWVSGGVPVTTDEMLGNASGAVSIANGATLKTAPLPSNNAGVFAFSPNPNWTSARTISVNSGGGNFDTNSYAWTLSGTTNYNAGLTKLSTGTVEFSGNQNWANGSSLTVAGGAVRYNLTSGTATVGTGVTATVNAGATLELSGTTSALGSTGGNRVNVTNNSTTSVNVTGTNQVVGAITGVGNTNVSNDSDLTAKQVVQNNLTINGTAGNPNAKVTIDNDGTTPNPNSVLNTLTSLTMANDGGASVYGGPFRTFYSELDLKDNNLAIRAPAGTGQTVWTSDILPGVLTGFNNGAFGNKGITSSTAPGAGNTALAAILNDDGFGNVLFGSGADIGAGSGQTEFDSLGALTIDDILIKYTYYGDLDLSGQVDGLDQALMDIFFGSVAGGWLFGDIDYNGFTDGLDQALLDIFFGNGTGGGFGDPLGGSDSGPATIPEPASLTLLALGGCWLMHRRQKRD